MKKTIAFLLAIFVCFGVNCYAQGKVSRPTKQQQSQTSKPKKSTPKVTVSEPDGYINGHGYVDLGLPSGTKWATCNIGAKSPEEAGDYFAWGEIESKSYYDTTNSIVQNKDISSLRQVGIIDASSKLNYSHDAATVKLGKSWRIPTEKECEELCDKCKWVWIKINDKMGYQIIGPNGKNIFLSASGYRYKDSIEFNNIEGDYWTCNMKDFVNGIGVYALGFNPKSHIVNALDELYTGHSIRPVVQ